MSKMALEAILESFKWADEQVRTQYMKIGRKIPDVAYIGICIGMVGAVMLISEGIRGFVPEFDTMTMAPHVLLDTMYASAFLQDLDIKSKLNGNALAENPLYAHWIFRLSRTYARGLRLPMIVAAGAAAAKVGYDIAMLVSSGEPLDQHTLAAFEAAAGLLADSSLMYLRDQDSSPRQKMRNPLKMLLEKTHAAYERAKGALRPPVPAPQPQAGLAY